MMASKPLAGLLRAERMAHNAHVAASRRAMLADGDIEQLVNAAERAWVEWRDRKASIVDHFAASIEAQPS